MKNFSLNRVLKEKGVGGYEVNLARINQLGYWNSNKCLSSASKHIDKNIEINKMVLHRNSTIMTLKWSNEVYETKVFAGTKTFETIFENIMNMLSYVFNFEN